VIAAGCCEIIGGELLGYGGLNDCFFWYFNMDEVES